MLIKNIIPISAFLLTINSAFSQTDTFNIENPATYLLEPDEHILISKLEAEINKNPKAIRNYLMLGTLYENQLDFNQAEDLYRKAIIVDSTCSICYQQLANIYTAKGMISNAIQSYNKSLIADSTNKKARIQLARLLKRENRFKESVEHWTHLLLNDTSNFYVWEQIGDCAMNLNDKGWAWNAYFNSYYLNTNNLTIAAKIGQIGIQQKVPSDYFGFVVDSALSIDSLYIPLLRVKGAMMFNSKNYKESIHYYHKAFAQGDSSRLTLKQLGISLNMRKQFSESLSFLEKAFMADSTDLLTNFFLAKSLNNTGNPDKAIEILKLSENLMNPLPEELSTLYEEFSISYLLKNDCETAIQQLNKALASNPSKIEFLLSVAILYEEMLGDKKSALENLKRFLDEVELLKANKVDVSKYDWEIEKAQINVKRLTEDLFFRDEL